MRAQALLRGWSYPSFARQQEDRGPVWVTGTDWHGLILSLCPQHHDKLSKQGRMQE